MSSEPSPTESSAHEEGPPADGALETHFWLTRGDQKFLVAVCIVLLSMTAVHAWRVSDQKASAEILNLANPDLTWRIDINTASAAELTLFHQIGPARADMIVSDREQNGPFESLDDLQRIKGIGPKTVEKNRRWMRVGDDETIGAESIDQPE